MKILYWNCTYGVGDGFFQKKKVDLIRKVLQIHSADLVCLDEVSRNVGDAVTAQKVAENLSEPGGTEYEHPAGGIIINDGAHLNSVILVRRSTERKRGGEPTDYRCESGVADPSWGFAMNRDSMRVRYKIIGVDKQYAAWFLHANASPAGGKAAVTLVDEFLVSGGQRGTSQVFVGDFNFAFQERANILAASTVSRIGPPDVTGIPSGPYTQWKSGELREPGWYPVPGSGTRAFKPSDILDFAITATMKVRAEQSLAGLTIEEIRDMMLWMDHCPIVYTVG